MNENSIHICFKAKRHIAHKMNILIKCMEMKLGSQTKWFLHFLTESTEIKFDIETNGIFDNSLRIPFDKIC